MGLAMLLAIDTSTAACTAALIDSDGALIDGRDELIGRGHSEQLVPMLDKLLGGGRVDTILVGVGPGSFTGIRVGIAAAQGLAIGWNAELHGMSSLALLAAGSSASPCVAAAMIGGHGELFVQQFGAGLTPETPVLNLRPEDAAEAISAPLVVGPGASQLVAARGTGEARETWPSAANALTVPVSLRTMPPKPVYARAPDARAKAA